MITQLLQEVYQVNQGQCKELDQELALLIDNIEKDGIDNIDKAALSTIVSLREQLHRNIESQRELFTQQNEELQSIESISANHFSPIPTHSDNNSLNTATLLHQVIKVLDNYRSAVKVLDDKLQTEQSRHEQVFSVHKDSLLELYQDIHVSIAHKAQLQELNAELNACNNINDVLINTKELIALLLKNINSEKETSQYFLKALNEALLNVKNIVDETAAYSLENQDKREIWDSGVSLNVNNIKEAVSGDNDQVQLRQRISKEIEDILTAMALKQEFDQEENTKLAKQFEHMEHKLLQVEAEAKEYKSQLDEQKQLNLQDTLTKLPNRAALDQRFSHEFKNAKDYDKPLWVVVADIDHFKRINDTYGHNAGDKTLQVIASAISRCLRGSEFIARYGGEEFVFLIPLASKDSVVKILNRVREHIKAIPFKFKQERLTITISLGATKVKLEDQNTIAAFERADKALYKAKNGGRDQVVVN